MLGHGGGKQLAQIVEEAERLLRRWEYGVRADGGLWIHPAGPVLETRELGTFLRLLADIFAEDAPAEVVFDLSAIEYLGPRWTVALAMFIDFAQRVNAPCRIAGIEGQPAAVASLYHRSPQVRALLSGRDAALVTKERQIA